ncbi:hypothetical protein GCM10008927_12310 [Amylibacter ulvae]|uniref:DUF1963 domain-containing protein n=1 Tax=Paramylibacter ulvae TaxID=1651968 RepID=A0ABQ3CXJ9_9RHOB|nr:DUF1963 domain-containing protein [Amylibacter ulvae]GHA48720.1 hypothetical protein GCM10008927_12310 [Amylibacter ulvae]
MDLIETISHHIQAAPIIAAITLALLTMHYGVAWLWNRRKSASASDSEVKEYGGDGGLIADMMKAGAGNNSLEQREAKERENPPTSLRIVPQVPIRTDVAYNSWFGGHPYLPDEANWPVAPNDHMHFLAQINCADIHPHVWGGAGPRKGWLVVFLTESWPPTPLILYTQTLGKPRSAPTPSDKMQQWFEPKMETGLVYQPVSPRWPVQFGVHTMGMDDPFDWQEDNAITGPARPDPRTAIPFDIQQPHFRPFDWASTLHVLKFIKTQKQSQRSAFVDRNAMKLKSNTMNPDQLAQYNQTVSQMDGQLSKFQMLLDTAQNQAQTKPFTDTELEASFGLVSFFFGETFFQDNQRDYQRAMYEYCKHLYTQAPNSLPDTHRAYYESLWAFDARREIGAVGNIPRGNIDLFIGQDSDDVVLLELPSSAMMGWVWAENRDLVITMKRSDLRHSYFGNLGLHLTT